jgi:hypothetical protein
VHGLCIIIVMPKGDYPSAIDGVRFLKKRELPPVSMCWDFQTGEMFPAESARRLFNDLPEDCEISFIDPEAGQEEAWIFVRRAGQHYFVRRVRHGSFPPWSEQSLETVLASFSSSPLVRNPSDSFESFTVSSIPDHQRYEHTKEKA